MPASSESFVTPHLSAKAMPSRPVSRRKLLSSLMPRNRRPDRPGAPPATAATPQATAGPPGQGKPDRWPASPERLLVDRLTYGYHPSQAALAESLGYRGYFEYQLDYESIDDSEIEAALTAYVSLTMSAAEIYNTYWLNDQIEIPFYELKYAAMLREIFSPRQLYERMVEFWSDHFSIEHADDLCLIFKTQDDRDVIRPNALKTFSDLLHASAQSPAMVQYLDNYSNMKGVAQENYARELLELHTLGVDGPYTEDDVKEVARCFTGWTFHRVANLPGFGEFYFSPGAHDTGAKTVLGVPIPAGGGKSDALAVLDILAHHPSTAHFIAKKLVIRFVGDSPPADLVDRVAQVFLATGGDIKSMLREVFSPDAPARFAHYVRPKFRRPMHLIASTLRALEIGVTDALGILYEGILQSHYPFGWHPPNGYPDQLSAWGHNLRPRWSFAARLLDNQVYGTPVIRQNIVALVNGTGLPDKADAINEVLTGGQLDPRDVQSIREFIESAPVYNWRILREGIALAVSSLSYQFH